MGSSRPEAPSDANLADILDLLEETALPLKQLAKQEGVHISTAIRWTGNGVNGIPLESYRRAGKRVTTLEAVARWHVRLNAANQSTRVQPRTNRQRETAIRRAKQALERDGVLDDENRMRDPIDGL